MSWFGDWLGEWFGAWFSESETDTHQASGACVFPATSGSGNATHSGSLGSGGGGYARLITPLTGKRRVIHRASGRGEFIIAGHGQAAAYHRHLARGRAEFIANGHGQAVVYHRHLARGHAVFIANGHGVASLSLGDDQLVLISDLIDAWS